MAKKCSSCACALRTVKYFCEGHTHPLCLKCWTIGWRAALSQNRVVRRCGLGCPIARPHLTYTSKPAMTPAMFRRQCGDPQLRRRFSSCHALAMRRMQQRSRAPARAMRRVRHILRPRRCPACHGSASAQTITGGVSQCLCGAWFCALCEHVESSMITARVHVRGCLYNPCAGCADLEPAFLVRERLSLTVERSIRLVGALSLAVAGVTMAATVRQHRGDGMGPSGGRGGHAVRLAGGRLPPRSRPDTTQEARSPPFVVLSFLFQHLIHHLQRKRKHIMNDIVTTTPIRLTIPLRNSPPARPVKKTHEWVHSPVQPVRRTLVFD